MKHFALAGNPNSGKTTLYNALTGSTAHVGNWPGVTVEKREGTYKKLGEAISIVDLPGIYSLSPYTPEEIISRNFIVDEKPDCVINIVDATNLERNLYLTTQILEMDVPVVIALNMMDVIDKNGDKIDIKTLEEALGVPVVAISAQKKNNIDDLMKVAVEASNNKRVGKTFVSNNDILGLIENVKNQLIKEEVSSPLYFALKIIENDEIETPKYKEAAKIVDDFKEKYNDPTFGSDLEAIVADQRYTFISNECSKAKTINEENKEERENSKTRKIDKILTNRWAGIPIFLVILFLIFHLTFSENLFYLGGLFNNVTPSFAGSPFEGLLWTDAGINSPGVILFNLLDCSTAWLGERIADGMSMAGAAPWAKGLVCDGIVAGVFAVLSFVPQILLLFLFFSILEDSGYMARVAFILDRIFRKFGLSGRAFLPMIMGFGCSVPAMINTRTLAEEKERVATIRVIPFFSCGAKLPILTAIAGGICQVFNFPNVDVITYSMYLVGIITAIVTVILMRNTFMRGATAPFIMELPDYHRPQFSALMIHMWDKLKGYVKKAFTIILASTIIIWFLQSFTFDWKYIEQANPNGIADDAYAALIEDATYKTAFITFDEANEYGLTEDGKITAEFADVITTYNEIKDETKSLEFKTVIITPVMTNALVEYKTIISDPNYKNTGDSILAGFGKLVRPLFTPLGFGSQLNENGWVYGVSAVTGLIAKENVIATFTILAQSVSDSALESVTLNPTDNSEAIDKYIELYNVGLDEGGISAAVATINNTGISKNNNGFLGWSILIAFIVFNMTTIPCFAAVATAKGELGKKYFKTTILFWIAVSYIAASMVYVILSAWWTSFIFALAFVGLAFLIKFINKKRDAKAGAR